MDHDLIQDSLITNYRSPTMAKWSKSELLCNARGLDDGYLYMYKRHPFGKKLAKLALEGNKTAASSKERITDSAAYGFAGFTGSVRPPLSNEVYPLDLEGKSDNVRVPLPSSASKIDRASHDNLFSEPIESNEVVCVAFTEPMKYSHKSILLSGAKPLPCKLTQDDLRIRRPKLNRGGGTIANLGMSRSGGGQSYQSGYGSMNISSYERDLAQRTGRGHEMNQPGTRAWGAMEPTPKRHRGGPPPHIQQQQQYHQQQRPVYAGHNPFSGQNRGPPPPPHQQQGPPWQQHSAGHHQNLQRPPWQPLLSQPPPPPPPPPPAARGPHGRHPYQQQAQRHQHPQRLGPGQPPIQQGYNFQSFSQHASRPPQASARPPQQQQGRADKNVMSNLRAQLVSTLKQNRKPGQNQK